MRLPFKCPITREAAKCSVSDCVVTCHNKMNTLNVSSELNWLSMDQTTLDEMRPIPTKMEMSDGLNTSSVTEASQKQAGNELAMLMGSNLSI